MTLLAPPPNPPLPALGFVASPAAGGPVRTVATSRPGMGAATAGTTGTGPVASGTVTGRASTTTGVPANIRPGTPDGAAEAATVSPPATGSPASSPDHALTCADTTATTPASAPQASSGTSTPSSDRTLPATAAAWRRCLARSR